MGQMGNYGCGSVPMEKSFRVSFDDSISWDVMDLKTLLYINYFVLFVLMDS